MDDSTAAPVPSSPKTWQLVLAFSLVYLIWGTTYLAIKEGVKTLPPALFGGVRICAAGTLILGYLLLRGERLRLTRREFFWTLLGAVFLFMGGNGLITAGQRTVPSGVASVLVATTPFWIALFEMLWPDGERLNPRGWLGLSIGMTGVLILLSPKLHNPGHFLQDVGPLLVIASAASWAIGSIISRYRRASISHLATAGYQMFLGGCSLVIVGLIFGEHYELDAEDLTTGAVGAFFYLLFVGSLIGFVAFNWLLGHVSAALVGTYAYVNPLVAILVGWLLGGEDLSAVLIGGMVVILVGVSLVRGGVRHKRPRSQETIRTGTALPSAPTQARNGLPCKGSLQGVSRD